MDKKTVLITGATRGMGFAISKELSSRGMRVIMACREKRTGERSVSRLKAVGLDVELAVCDVENIRSINKAAETIAKKYPVLDILINNAGVSGEPMTTTIETIDLKIFQHIMDVNLRGTMWCISKFLPLLKRSKEARIINFSSGLAHFHSRKQDRRYRIQYQRLP